jgi:hypothetical protein
VKSGLIPTDESGTYSNTFIGASEDGKLRIEDEWKPANGTVWVVSEPVGQETGLTAGSVGPVQ